jgi:hypothetical protein
MKIAFTLVTALIAQTSLPAMACGYDALINNPFTLGYSGSVVVALNTQQALAKGELSRIPQLTGTEGLARASGWLDQLRARLQTAQLPSRFSVYLVDAGLWTRFDVLNDSVLLQSHSTPEKDETVLVISEATLSALLRNQVNLEQAEKLGLVRWSKQADPQVITALNTATANAQFLF